jgi:hypothetical protein
VRSVRRGQDRLILAAAAASNISTRRDASGFRASRRQGIWAASSGQRSTEGNQARARLLPPVASPSRERAVNHEPSGVEAPAGLAHSDQVDVAHCNRSEQRSRLLCRTTLLLGRGAQPGHRDGPVVGAAMSRPALVVLHSSTEVDREGPPTERLERRSLVPPEHHLLCCFDRRAAALDFDGRRSESAQNVSGLVCAADCRPTCSEPGRSPSSDWLKVSPRARLVQGPLEVGSRPV